MVNWTQTGRNPELDGEWAGKGSKADFKSRLEIVSPSGTLIPFTSTSDGIVEWESISPNSTIKWAVDTDGKSDRAELKLTYFNVEKYLSAYNQVLDSLTEEEIQMLESGNTKFTEEVSERAFKQAGGIETLFITIWSDVVGTDDNGKANGVIEINETFPKNTSYIFTAHYGYDANQEKSEASKTGQFVWDITTTTAMFVPIPGVQQVAWAAFLGEMTLYGAQYIASGRGRAGENKYGKFFPVGGFNHVYSFYLEDPQETPQDYVASIFSDENLDIVQKMNLLAQFYGTVKIGAGLAGALILIALLKGRRS